MKKYILTIVAVVLLMFGACTSALAAEFAVTESTAAADAPEDSEMIVALYGGDSLNGLRIYSGGETARYAEDMPSELEQSDTIKVFLWDMSSLEPYGDAFSAPLDSLPSETNALIVYFSATGNTRSLADKIAAVTGADVYEIVPEVPYTSADLNYNNDSSRANQEMNDPDARPAIDGTIENIDEYDTIILGYPIWWGTMPRIINTFLDTYDLSGKTIMPFCTSGGSGITSSVSSIRSICAQSTVTDGFRGTSSTTESQIQTWLETNGFYEPAEGV